MALVVIILNVVRLFVVNNTHLADGRSSYLRAVTVNIGSYNFVSECMTRSFHFRKVGKCSNLELPKISIQKPSPPPFFKGN